MINFYTNPELAQKFDVKLARWKRWSREFLPPDPLGGLQSGYARQYSVDEAFTVVLGGHLVRVLKFSIPETRQILLDLHQWLVDHDFYLYFSKSTESSEKLPSQAHGYFIAIATRAAQHHGDFGMSYRIRSVISDDLVRLRGVRVRREHFVESFIGLQKSVPFQIDTESYRVLNISGLHKSFLKRLGAQ